MPVLNIVFPCLSFLVSVTSAVLILRRFALKGGPHLLLWGLGIIMYGIGGACEALYGLWGWSPVAFRLWYLFGAILVAAWLGQGTVYLLFNRTVAHVLMAILLVASVYAAVRVFRATLDPSLMTGGLHTGSELSGRAVVTPGVRTLTPFFNSYGTLALVGGAIWSAIFFWRKRVMLHRTIGSALIALGAILPAFGGTFSRFGGANALYLCELLGAILILLGFLRSTTPMRAQSTARSGASPR